MTQPGETAGYSASMHLRALVDHAGDIVNYMIINTEGISSRLVERYHREGSAPVEPDLDAVRKMGVEPVTARLVQEGDLVRHHPDRLARTLMRLISNRYPGRVVSLNGYIKHKQASNSRGSAVL